MTKTRLCQQKLQRILSSERQLERQRECASLQNIVVVQGKPGGSVLSSCVHPDEQGIPTPESRADVSILFVCLSVFQFCRFLTKRSDICLRLSI